MDLGTLGFAMGSAWLSGMVALLIGGGIALSSHTTKTATRLAANTSPEPFSNIALSLIGDALTVGGTLLMTVHPAVLVAFVCIALLLSVLLVRWLWSAMKRLFSRSPAPSVA